jgi:PAS domain S-box-containing protein
MAQTPKPTILNVDDNDAGRYVKSRILLRADFEVYEAANGEDALRMAAELKPQLVLLDVRLPDISGIEVCRRIKADPATGSILVIQTSATFLDSRDRVRGLEGGADSYLTEPIEGDELVANVRAILRLRQAEQAVREREAWLATTLRSIGDAVIATDPEGCVTLINPVAQTLVGWGEAEAKGRSLTEVFQIVDEQTRQAYENLVARVLREGAIAGLTNHTVLVAKDGRETPIDNSAAPIKDEQGKLIGVVLIFRDITERKRAEESLREADRRKDEFLAMLAHELRNPLASIRNAAQVMKLLGSADANLRRAREVIERQMQHLTRLVDDLLDVSRITQGKVTLQREPLDLSMIIQRAVETSRPLIDARKHQMTLTLPPKLVRVEGDLTRLVQVLSNLLNNAAKFTDEGGHIRLKAAEESGEAVIRIRDNGMGLPADLLPRVFDRFTQAKRSPDRLQGGLGLSLALVRNLVEMHGGKVEARSEGLGQGSEFIVRLPLLALAAPGVEESQDKPKRLASNALRVLLVEDNVDSAEMMAFTLRLGGHEVRTAHDGLSALEVACAFRPQVVLCDIGMPGIDGHEVATRLRAQPEFKQTRIIALSGYGQEEDRRRSKEVGFDYHLTKPVEPEALEALLDSLRSDGRTSWHPLPDA